MTKSQEPIYRPLNKLLFINKNCDFLQWQCLYQIPAFKCAVEVSAQLACLRARHGWWTGEKYLLSGMREKWVRAGSAGHQSPGAPLIHDWSCSVVRRRSMFNFPTHCRWLIHCLESVFQSQHQPWPRVLYNIVNSTDREGWWASHASYVWSQDEL